MDSVLGQPSRVIFCSRFTVLTDELCKIQKETKTLVVSCLTGIIANLITTEDIKTSLEKAMQSIGAVMRGLVRNNPGLRIMIANCTPRETTDFETHSKFALVHIKRYLIKVKPK
jgi:hypothetical protein